MLTVWDVTFGSRSGGSVTPHRPPVTKTGRRSSVSSGLITVTPDCRRFLGKTECRYRLRVLTIPNASTVGVGPIVNHEGNDRQFLRTVHAPRFRTVQRPGVPSNTVPVPEGRGLGETKDTLPLPSTRRSSEGKKKILPPVSDDHCRRDR